MIIYTIPTRFRESPTSTDAMRVYDYALDTQIIRDAVRRL